LYIDLINFRFYLHCYVSVSVEEVQDLAATVHLTIHQATSAAEAVVLSMHSRR